MSEDLTVIQLGSWRGWRLAAAPHGWQMEELRGAGGPSEKWASRKTFPTLEHAALGAYERAARRGADDLEGARAVCLACMDARAFVVRSVRRTAAYALYERPGAPAISCEHAGDLADASGVAAVVQLGSWHGWRLAAAPHGWQMEELRGAGGPSEKWASRKTFPTLEHAALGAYERAFREVGAHIADAGHFSRACAAVSESVIKAVRRSARLAGLEVFE